MKITPALLPLGLALPLILPARPSPQADQTQAAIAARIGDETISLSEYKDYLLEIYAKGPLKNLIDRRLLHREAARLGIEVDPEQLELATQREWDSYLQRFKGVEAGFVAEIEAQGFSREAYYSGLRDRKRDEQLAAAIVLQTRSLSEDAVRERFNQQYGLDGIAVEVRHIFFTPARLRIELQRQGKSKAELTPEHLNKLLREKATALLTELRAGGDFAALAAEHSHDISAPKNGGMIQGYNYRTYGDEFALAVRKAELGVPTGPVQTKAGLHIIEVTSRKQTDFDDVRDELEGAMLLEEPSWKETNQLRLDLREKTEITIY